MDPISTELLKYGLPGVVIIGLVAAIRILRSEHFQREGVWREILAAKEQKIEAFVMESMGLLKEDVRVRVEQKASLDALAARIDGLMRLVEDLKRGA